MAPDKWPKSRKEDWSYNIFMGLHRKQKMYPAWSHFLANAPNVRLQGALAYWGPPE